MSDSRARTIRLAILGNCRLAREALATYFAGLPGFTVVGHISSVDCLAQLCMLTSPSVALVEVDQPDLPAVRAWGELRRRHPSMELIVVFTTLPAEVLAEATRHGITTFVPGSAGLDAMARTVRRRAHRIASTTTAVNGQTLTDRELAVASLIGAGHTTDDIAGLLRISAHTVDNHRRSIYTKFGVDNQSAAVAHATSLGLVQWPSGAHPIAATRSATPPRLTVRETEILGHIALGHTTRQTARALGIAAKTVENTQARLYRKLGTRNRGETLAVAYRMGLIEPTTRP